jgi:hypothetical protein
LSLAWCKVSWLFNINGLVLRSSEGSNSRSPPVWFGARNSPSSGSWNPPSTWGDPYRAMDSY